MRGTTMNDTRGRLRRRARTDGPNIALAARPTAASSGRVAALLLVLAGLVTIASVALPAPVGVDRTGVVVVGAAGAALGAVLLTLPWHRWPARASLVLVVPALVLIALHNWFGGDDAYRYSIFFLVVFVWVGTFHRRGTPMLLAFPTAVAYLVPLVLGHAPAFALASAAYAVPLFVIVGEILAWRSSRVASLEAELRAAALHDPLTGLANRRLAVERLDECLARAARSGDYVHVLYMDVDEFKTINDTSGHEAGDNQLVAIARVLSAAVRPSDVVARMGGDEFVVVVEATDGDAGHVVAARIMGAVHEERRGRPDGIPTVSIGVASTAGGAYGADEVLNAADAALYAAKAAGKDGIASADALPRRGPAASASE